MPAIDSCAWVGRVRIACAGGEGEGGTLAAGEGEGDTLTAGEGEGDVLSAGEGEGDMLAAGGLGEIDTLATDKGEEGNTLATEDDDLSWQRAPTSVLATAADTEPLIDQVLALAFRVEVDRYSKFGGCAVGWLCYEAEVASVKASAIIIIIIGRHRER